MLTLLHGDMGWVVAGLTAFIGIMFFLAKIARGHIVSAIISGLVWFFVYSMHKGSTQGIMTATFAALLFDIFGLPIIMLLFRFK